jgi:ubiquinone/menaquinone biosynthesis C-methylase UbiE
MTSEQGHYIIRSGMPGRERLRILAAIFHETTTALLRPAGIGPGMTCLDLGCGGGDVAVELAKLVGPDGHVTGIDIDETSVAIARREAAEQGLANIEYRQGDARNPQVEHEVDAVYARFLLTHVPDPVDSLRNMRRVLRPGGVIVIEDVDFSGCFSAPERESFRRFVDLYTRTAARRGADANIGVHLPLYLKETGFAEVRLNVIQPAGFDEFTKALLPSTMENIVEAVVAADLGEREELEWVVNDLYDAASDPGQILSHPRVVQTWAIAA